MERFEYQPKQERNLAKDRLSFIEAIEKTHIAEMEVEFDEDTINNLRTELERTGIFLLGETHGVEENPGIIYTLFKKFGFRNLALEWEPRLKQTVEQFLQTGILDFDSMKESLDGRITAGHFALLKKLKEEGLLDTLVCFDEGSGGRGWNQRDANMARNILTHLSETPTLVVAGNLHTEIHPITFNDDVEEKHPMGEHVREQIPDAPSGRIRYLSGEFHNYGTRKFKIKPDDIELPPAKFYQSEEDLYVFELPQAHAAVVPNPNESLN